MASKLILVALLVICSSLGSRAWFFRGGFMDEKNCFCKAVDNHSYSRVLLNFGSIDKCRAFPRCGCGRPAMMNCEKNCEKKVKEWVCLRNCDGKHRGTSIRSSFKASVCHSNQGEDIYVCGKKTNCGR